MRPYYRPKITEGLMESILYAGGKLIHHLAAIGFTPAQIGQRLSNVPDTYKHKPGMVEQYVNMLPDEVRVHAIAEVMQDAGSLDLTPCRRVIITSKGDETGFEVSRHMTDAQIDFVVAFTYGPRQTWVAVPLTDHSTEE